MAMTNLKENNGSSDKISNQEFCRCLWDLIYQNLFLFFFWIRIYQNLENLTRWEFAVLTRKFMPTASEVLLVGPKSLG